jgi:hypothetical protein
MNDNLANNKKVEHHAYVPIHLPWRPKMFEYEKQTKKGSV